MEKEYDRHNQRSSCQLITKSGRMTSDNINTNWMYRTQIISIRKLITQNGTLIVKGGKINNLNRSILTYVKVGTKEYYITSRQSTKNKHSWNKSTMKK